MYTSSSSRGSAAHPTGSVSATRLRGVTALARCCSSVCNKFGKDVIKTLMVWILLSGGLLCLGSDADAAAAPWFVQLFLAEEQTATRHDI